MSEIPGLSSILCDLPSLFKIPWLENAFPFFQSKWETWMIIQQIAFFWPSSESIVSGDLSPLENMMWHPKHMPDLLKIFSLVEKGLIGREQNKALVIITSYCIAFIHKINKFYKLDITK